MLRTCVGLLLILIVVFPLAAQNPENEVQFQFVNLSPEYPQVKVWVDGEVIIETVEFEHFSEWVTIAEGEHDILVTDLEDNPILEPTPFIFTTTIIGIIGITGTTAENNLTLFGFEVEIDAPALHQVRINFYNTVADSIFRIDGGGEVLADEILQNDPIVVEEIPYNRAIQFFTDNEPIFEIPASAPHQVYMAIAAQVGGEVKVYVNQISYNTAVRIANFAPDSVSVDVLIGDELQIPNTVFEQVTGFINLPTGTYEVTVVPSGQGVENVLLPPQEITFTDATARHTLLLIKQTDTLQLALINQAEISDNEDLLAGKNALVEVRHTIEAAPAIDIVLADGTVFIEGLAFGQVGVMDLPEGAYDFRITVSGEPDNILYERGATLLEGGQLYWMTLIGRYENVVIGQQRLSLVSYCVAIEGCE